VQRRALKFVLDDYSSGYKERLILCGILPLSLRRDYLDMIFFYNFLHNITEVNLDVTFVNASLCRRRAAIDDLMLVKRINNYNFVDKWYCNRIVHVWNKLPYELRGIQLTYLGKNITFKKNFKIWLYEFFVKNFVSETTCSWKVFCGCAICKET
jgi:hypothetical protein